LQIPVSGTALLVAMCFHKGGEISAGDFELQNSGQLTEVGAGEKAIFYFKNFFC